jgi:hypothetical protein
LAGYQVTVALTRTDLDGAQCAVSHGYMAHISPHHNDELYFHSQCHPDWPTWVRYADGVLIITCSQDENEVARIAVADGS